MGSAGEARCVTAGAGEEEQEARAALSAAVQASSLAWAHFRDKLDVYDAAQPETVHAFEESRHKLQEAERASWEAAERLFAAHDRQNRLGAALTAVSLGAASPPEEPVSAGGCVGAAAPPAAAPSPYEDLMRRMTAEARAHKDVPVSAWQAEIGERNFERMRRLATLVREVGTVHSDHEVDDEVKAEVHTIGADIHDEGGFQAMQAVYYTLFNFVMETSAEDKACVRNLNWLWDGIGDWQV